MGARLLRRYGTGQARVLIGRDTRESSIWIAGTLAAGLRAAGAEYVNTGVMTTPGVACLTRARKFSAGIVISASHNPWMDNGIKLFGRDGMKLADAIEHEIEQEIFSHLDELAGDFDGSSSSAPLTEAAGLRESYVEWLATNVDVATLRGARVSDRLRKRRLHRGRAGTVPPVRSRSRSSFTSRRMDATSTPDAERCIPSMLPPRCAIPVGLSPAELPSMETATARCLPTSGARWSMATQ